MVPTWRRPGSVGCRIFANAVSRLGEIGRDFAHVPRDGAHRIDDIDHGVNAFVKQQRAVPIVGGRRLLLRDQNIGTGIIERQITRAAHDQNVAHDYAFVNARQIFPVDLNFVGVEFDGQERPGPPASPALP